MFVKFWILNLMTKYKKPYYTTPRLGLFNCLYLSQLLTDFGQILDSKSYDQVCKYPSMPECQYARMQVYTCLYKKLNRNKDGPVHILACKIFLKIVICFSEID